MKLSVLPLMAFALLSVAARADGLTTWTAALNSTLADHAKLDKESRYYVRYLWAPYEAGSSGSRSLGAALAFDLPSNSTALNLDRQIPVKIAEGVWRIDLRALKWNVYDWTKVIGDYPYGDLYETPQPLILRADWLIWELSDTFESKAHYLLTYGSRNVPKNRADWYRFWGVDADGQRAAKLTFGLVEERSNVSVVGTRFITLHDRARGHSASTEDVTKLDASNDYLEVAPYGGGPHDGEEHIVGYPKVSVKLGRPTVAQFYLLTNGKGERVERAPVDLVEDRRRFKGLAEIRNRGSCIVCHEQGMNFPTQNGLKRLITSGIEVEAKYGQEAYDLEAFHLTDVGTELARRNEDYAAFVEACNGLDPIDNAAVYQGVIERYRAKVTLERASYDLGCTIQELSFAVAAADDYGVKVPRAVTDLANGTPIDRTLWEAEFLNARKLLIDWRKR